MGAQRHMMDTAEAAGAVSGKLHGPVVRFAGVTTDSRAVARGELFIALKGERFDGHEYVEGAERQGAAASMVSRLVPRAARPQIVVKDTRLGLGHLAGYWRRPFPPPQAAPPRSNAKTTEKGMLP